MCSIAAFMENSESAEKIILAASHANIPFRDDCGMFAALDVQGSVMYYEEQEHNQLFTPACRETVRIISEGVIGEPFLIRTEGLGRSHVVGRGKDQHWRTTQAGGGGGALIDNGYHQLYRARAWMNSPVKRVMAKIGTFFHDIEVEDKA